MEHNPPPASSSPAPAPKKGLGTGAKIGIGCAAILGLIVIGLVVVTVMFGGKVKEFAEQAQSNPTRATASMMVSTGMMEMVAEDDVNKRYTVKEKKTGALTTIYWSAETNAPEVIEGDFSAIPATPAPAIEEK